MKTDNPALDADLTALCEKHGIGHAVIAGRIGQDLFMRLIAKPGTRDEGTGRVMFEIVEKAINDGRDQIAKPQTKEGYCGLCGLPMREGEEMFKYHGYSESCEQAKARLESKPA